MYDQDYPIVIYKRLTSGRRLLIGIRPSDDPRYGWFGYALATDAEIKRHRKALADA